jgi:glutaconate CoA-transferase subunit B
MYRVVTDLGIFGFEERSKQMELQALHPGVTADEVQANTGFELLLAADLAITERPTQDELAALRHLDPERLYTAWPPLKPSPARRGCWGDRRHEKER